MSPKLWTVEVTHPAETPKGESPVRRNVDARHGLTETPHPAIRTTYDLAQFNARKYGDAKCFGTRKVIKIHKETTQVTKIVNGVAKSVDKAWMFWELGPFEYQSYKEAAREGLDVGAGLVKLGLGSGDKVAIYADTSAHWQLIAQAAASQSMPIVTAYATLGEEGLTHSLRETDAKAIFLDPQLIPALLNPIHSSPSVKYIIYHGDPSQKDLDTLNSTHDHLTILSYDSLLNLGKENPVPPVPPKPTDVACIMYTSGSTGRPKGVILTHRNVIAAVSGAHHMVGPWTDNKGMRMLAYLPTAHIYGFVFELVAQYWGSIIGYARIRTLTDTSVRNCKGDLREFQPQFLTSIPAVWELIRKGIEGKIAEASPIVRGLFWTSMYLKDTMMTYGIPGSSLLDTIIFNKVKEVTGGHIFWSMYGGSGLSEETQRFICSAICPVASGYGLTETCAMGALSNPASWKYGYTGALETCVEAKLVDVPELGYFVSNTPSQGEVWLRGPSMTAGYLDRDEETAALFDPQGWLKTGDIGEFDKHGLLRIIDRVKNLVKTLNGEYIAIEKLEATYNTCNIVLSICVYADPNRYKPIAIVVPSEATLSKFVAAKGLASPDTSLESLVQDKKVVNAVLAELLAVGKRGGLTGIEMIQGLVLVSEEWTPENELLTAARKLNRKNILAKYKHLVDVLSPATSMADMKGHIYKDIVVSTLWICGFGDLVS